MSDDDTESEIWLAPVDRLNSFSDAVVSIAITLLALGLPIPQGKTPKAFLHSVHHGSADYQAFLISFVVIAAMWTAHHRVFRYCERSDSLLRQLNVLWLLAIVLNPFATKVLTVQSSDARSVHAMRWGFYAFLQMSASVLMVAMVQIMARRGLQTPDTPARFAARMSWRSAAQVIGFGLSIPVFLLTNYAWLLWAIVPLVVALYGERRTRRRA